MLKYVYQIVFTSSNDPTVDEVNAKAQDGWRVIQIGHREASPNQWAYLMEKQEEIIVETPHPVAADDFERADGPLGANWSDASDSPVIISGGHAAMGSDQGTVCASHWSATPFTDDQFSEITIGLAEGSLGALVRKEVGIDRFYLGFAEGGTVAKLVLRWDGAYVALTESETLWATGDRMRLGIRGTSPLHLNLYRNDELVLSWSSISPDQEKTGGSPGIALYGLNTSIASWNGGDIEGTNDTLVGTFTVSLSDDRILIPGHGLVNGDQVLFVLDDPATCALPFPLNESDYYFVSGARGNDFQVSSTDGGALINMTDRGIGSNEVWKKGA